MFQLYQRYLSQEVHKKLILLIKDAMTSHTKPINSLENLIGGAQTFYSSQEVKTKTHRERRQKSYQSRHRNKCLRTQILRTSFQILTDLHSEILDQFS